MRIFTRISNRIALQFMAFVFLLLLVNGALFLAADFENARRQLSARVTRTAQSVMESTTVGPNGITVALTPMMRDRVRVVDAKGTPVYTGSFFEDIPFSPTLGTITLHRDSEQHAVLTTAVRRGGEIMGYIQIAEMYRIQLQDLPPRAFLYLIVSIAISALTFLVGLLFARTSLQPAEDMMQRLEQFTQDASHELRTPLATLNSSLELALKTENYKAGIVSAKEDVKEIGSLIERMLDLARLDKMILTMEPVEFSLLVQDAAEKHKLLAEEKHIQIICDVQPDISVQGDATFLRQVLNNLLSNAIKFSKPEGGTIHIALTKHALTVKDSGVGIPQHSLSNIFDRFFQAETSRTNDGYGLGLALVKRIVELHGWTIEVESTEGQGTTFTVNIG